MRRWLALVLLVGLSGQASGGALAASPGTVLAVPMRTPAPAATSPARANLPRRVPQIHHTPLPPQPIPNYRNPKRYARFVQKRATFIENLGPRPRLLGPAELRRRTLLAQRLLGAQIGMAPHRRHRRWTVAGPAFPGSGGGARMHPNDTTSTPPPIGTGIERWWGYTVRDLPGVGRAFVNVANNNNLIQVDDVAIPAAGVDLAYRRTFNSLSAHDAADDDGSGPSVVGNRWTSTLDSHLSYSSSSSSTGTITVWDADGTRMDFFCTLTSGACATTTTGVYDQLAGVGTPIGGTYCRWQLTKKSGASYVYFAPYTGCQKGAGMYGKLLTIYARNQLNSIQLTYGFSPGDGDPENLASMTATHEPDGLSLELAFGQPAGGGPTELLTITRPDGQVIDYHYGPLGALTAVDKPGNQPWLPSGESLPSSFGDGGPSIPAGNLPEVYDFTDGGALLEVCGPRAAIGVIAGAGTDGACTDFVYDTNDNLTAWYTRGVLNPTPSDGTDTAIRPDLSQGFRQWDDTSFIDVNDILTQNGPVYETTVSDNYGHAETWSTDSLGRVIERDVQTGDASGPSTLTTTQTWGSNNNLTSYTDARGNLTQAGYDAQGNAVEVSLPSVNGKSPTSFYDYDSNNNVVAYCDPKHSGVTGWISPKSSDTLCSTNGTIYTQYSYTTDANNEPYGCLTKTTTPLGYQRTIKYSADGSCGNGLPISVTGGSMSQGIDSATPTRTPTQSFTYNGKGELTGYSDGGGTWSLGYDDTSTQMHRLLTITDPTNVTSYKCYYNDGSLSYTETAAQHADDSGSCQAGAVPAKPYAVVDQYDADGDEYSETHQYGRQTANSAESLAAGTTYKWYDGLDRLVEVEQPLDTYHDYFQFPWMTRYLYDINDGQQANDVAIGNATHLSAYGNLFKTQECLPAGGPIITAPSGGSAPQSGDRNCVWTDVRGTTYDAIDRVVSQYELSDNASQPITTNTWDGNGENGLLAQTANGVGETTTMTYDPDARLASTSFSDAPSTDRSYTYDLDGEPTQLSSPEWGTETKAYDDDERPVTVTEPTAKSHHGTITYGYYADGLRKAISLDIARASGDIELPTVLQYAYRTDGLLEIEKVNDNSGKQLFKPGSYQWTYDTAGRELTQSDPSTGDAFTATWSASSLRAQTYTVSYGPKTTVYGTLGRIQSVTLPTGTSFQSFTYDDEDEPLSYEVVPAPTASPEYNHVHLNEVSSYTMRGELAGSTYVASGVGAWDSTDATPCETGASGCSLLNGSCTPGDWGCIGFDVYANGVDLGGVATALQNRSLTQVSTYDIRSSQILGQVAYDCSPNEGVGCLANYVDTRTLTYDHAGRQTRTTALGCKYVVNVPYPGGGFTSYTYPAGSNEQRTYDAENHLTGRTVGIPTSDPLNNNQPDQDPCPHESAAAFALDWGLDGHPWVDTDNAGSNGVTTMHWDDDSILYTSSAFDGTDSYELYIGKLGVVDITPAQPLAAIMTYDRDWSGQTVQMHDDTSFSSLTPVSGDPPNFPHQVPGKLQASNCTLFENSLGCIAGSQATPAPPNPSPGPATISSYATEDMNRADGYNIEDVTIQGVRAYDPITSQWTTPDAYKGDVDDPMSQKPYMWNNNNPIIYNDPSGYCAVVISCPGPAIATAIRAASRLLGIAAGGVADAIGGAASVLIMAGMPIPVADSTLSVSDREKMLPKAGDIIFVPKKTKDGSIPRDRAGGYIDKYGNSWQWDATKQEWDVQNRGGGHTNVSPAGKRTHRPNKFPKGSRNNPNNSGPTNGISSGDNTSVAAKN